MSFAGNSAGFFRIYSHLKGLRMKVKCVRERASSALPVKSHLRRVMFTAAVLLLLVLFCTVPAAAVNLPGGNYASADELATALVGGATFSGTTVTLTDDVTVTGGTVNITGDITIVGGGHTIYRGVAKGDLIH